MALSLGNLFVKLSADTTGLTRGMTQGVQQLEKFGRKASELAGKVGMLSVAMTATGGVMVREAAKYDASVKRAVDGLGNAYKHVAVEIGRALLPAVQMLTRGMTALVSLFRSISPEAKQMAGSFAAISAGMLGATAGALKIGGAMASIGASVLPMLPVLAGVAVAVGAIALVTSVLAVAWEENWGGMQETTESVINNVADAWHQFVKFFTDKSGFIGKAWDAITKFLWDSWGYVMKGIANAVGKLAKLFGKDLTAEVEAFNETIEDMKTRGFAGLIDDASQGFEFMWGKARKGAGITARFIKEQLGEAFGGLGGGNLSRLAEIGSSEKRKMGAYSSSSEDSILAQQGMIGDRRIKAFIDAQLAKEERLLAQTEARVNLGNRTFDKGGEVAGLAKAGMEGAVAGGGLGALAAVAVELLARSRQFQKILSLVSDTIGIVADGLGVVFEPIVPIINVLNSIMKPLALAFGGLLRIVTLITNPALLLVTMALPALFEVFKWLSVGILYVTHGITTVWNGLLSAVQNVLFAMGNLIGADGLGKPLLAMGMALEGLKDYTNYIDAANQLMGMTLNDATRSIVDETVAREAATETITKLNDALTNVPAGFKVAAARFAATAAGGGPVSPFGGPPQVSVYVTLDGREMTAAVHQVELRQAFQTSGNYVPPSVRARL